VSDRPATDEIRRIAQRYLEEPGAQLEPQLVDAAAGSPLEVRTVEGDPAYWLVPAFNGEILVGAVRVSLLGALISVGKLDPARSGPVVTGITAAEARSKATASVDRAAGEEAGEPILACDGPPGREVWLVHVERDHRPVRRLFVGPGGTYPMR
jgi:hypothetical protein